MLYYFLWLVVALGFYAGLRHCRFQPSSIAVLLAGLGLAYFHLYSTNWGQFAVDYAPHTAYVEFLARNHSLPRYAVDILPSDAAFRHPPFYYMLCSVIYALAERMDGVLPMFSVRHLSMAFYAVFLLFGARTLKMAAGEDTPGFISGLLLLCFWPVGLTMGARISCDIPLYAAVAACGYYLFRFASMGESRDIALAWVAAGLAVLTKNAGFLFLIGTCAVSLFHLRRAFAPQALLGIAFAAACAVFAFEWHWFFAAIQPEMLSSEKPGLGDSLRAYLTFDVPLFFDESIYNVQQAPTNRLFWNYFLRSFLLGKFFEWKLLSVVFALGVVWMGLLVFVLVSALPRQERQWGMVALCILAVLMVAAQMYVHRFTGNPDYLEARYSFPALILLACAFARGLNAHVEAGREVAFRIGRMLALVLVGLSVALMMGQHGLKLVGMFW